MKQSATFVFLALLFSVFSSSFAQITVDGSAAEWTGTAPAVANTSVYSAGTAGSPIGYNEWIWTDANDDERTNFGSDAQVNLLEARVTGDNSNIYFLFRMEDIDNAEGNGAPQVQISVDKDMDGTGTDWLANNADTQAPSTALWEHLIYTSFGSHTSAEGHRISGTKAFLTRALQALPYAPPPMTSSKWPCPGPNWNRPSQPIIQCCVLPSPFTERMAPIAMSGIPALITAKAIVWIM